jgi:hypothetical protein
LSLEEVIMKKVVLFAFRGDPLCFVHVLLNALDMHEKGMQSGIVFEGSSVTLVGELAQPDHQFHGLYRQAMDKNLIFGVCRACAVKLGALQAAESEGLTLLDDMRGHAGMARFLMDGFSVITL